jgi:hypothetical protein
MRRCVIQHLLLDFLNIITEKLLTYMKNFPKYSTHGYTMS